MARTPFSPQHGGAQGPLRAVVGRLHPCHGQERPKGLPPIQQGLAKPGSLRAGPGNPHGQEGLKLGLERRRLRLQGSPVQFAVSVAIPAGEQVGRDFLTPGAHQLRARMRPLRERLQISQEMGPAEGALTGSKMVIGREAVTPDDLGVPLGQQPGIPKAFGMVRLPMWKSVAACVTTVQRYGRSRASRQPVSSTFTQGARATAWAIS